MTRLGISSCVVQMIKRWRKKQIFLFWFSENKYQGNITGNIEKNWGFNILWVLMKENNRKWKKMKIDWLMRKIHNSKKVIGKTNIFHSLPSKQKYLTYQGRAMLIRINHTRLRWSKSLERVNPLSANDEYTRSGNLIYFMVLDP